MLPAHGIVGVFAGDHLGRAKAQSDRLSRAAQIRPQLRRRAQCDDLRADRTTGAQIGKIGRALVHRRGSALSWLEELEQPNLAAPRLPFPRRRRYGARDEPAMNRSAKNLEKSGG